ncbi:MAG: anti-sigma factor domain-containing protein [Acidimicrobiales bacterium]
MSPLAHEEIQELLGAYALDAVEADEAEAIEQHLEGCPRCRAEVEGHREVATMLGNSGGDAPEGLWDRIAGQLEDTPPPMRLEVQPASATVTPLAARRRERSNRLVLAAIGAAAVLAIAVLGAQVVSQRQRLDDMESALEQTELASAASRAFDAPDARKLELQSADGAVVARAVLLPDGSGFLMAHELPELDADRTYQLWGDTGAGQLVSLGLLGDDPATVVFEAGAHLDALAITAEDAGGVSQSRNPPVVAGAFD